MVLSDSFFHEWVNIVFRSVISQDPELSSRLLLQSLSAGNCLLFTTYLSFLTDVSFFRLRYEAFSAVKPVLFQNHREYLISHIYLLVVCFVTSNSWYCNLLRLSECASLYLLSYLVALKDDSYVAGHIFDESLLQQPLFIWLLHERLGTRAVLLFQLVTFLFRSNYLIFYTAGRHSTYTWVPLIICL